MTQKNGKKKKIILYCKGNTGCSHVRLRYYANYINAIDDYGYEVITLNSHDYTYDPVMLNGCGAIIFEKASDKLDLDAIKRYKALQNKYGFSLVYELDDLIFRSTLSDSGVPEGIPNYNFASLFSQRMPEQKLAERDNRVGECMNLCDVVSVSTEYLGKVIKTMFKHKDVRVIKNTVPRYLWNCNKKEHIYDNLIKPVVLYTGSPCHFMNPRPEVKRSNEYPFGAPGSNGDAGDWNTVFKEWVYQNVANNKIEFVIIGSLPYFLEPIISNIKLIPWANSYKYPSEAMNIKADFQIAPLVDNEMNRCKSAIKYYESAVCGSVLLGSTFANNNYSPYEELDERCKVKDGMTVEQLNERFSELCKANTYNELLDIQYDMLNNGRILESDKSLKEFLSVCDYNKNKR